MPINPSLPFKSVSIAVLTVSDTRDPATDMSGKVLMQRVEAAGHRVYGYRIVRDISQEIEERVRFWVFDKECDVIITTGGTGLTGRDITPEALRRIWDKEIDGFGELFRLVSIRSIGTSMVQSRACAGVARGTYIFALPGSVGAVTDGWDKILKEQLDSRYQPCNFVSLMPRLREK